VISTIFYVLLCAAISLLLAWSLIRRRKTLQGLILGLAPIAIMEAIVQGALQFRIQRCLEEACLAKGLPADCGVIDFGCTEWSIPSALMLWGVGLAALVLYAIGAVILTLRARGRPPAAGG